MNIDLSDLIKGIPEIEKMVADTAVEVTTKVTLDVHRNVVMATPVDTGAARGAWTVETPTKPYDDGTVENNIEYIVPLVDGHSSQAPAGWLDNAIEAATRL